MKTDSLQVHPPSGRDIISVSAVCGCTVGVDERHQRKGLAKSLMLKTIQLYSSLHCEHPLYLTTQTNSYVAISMYQRLGFTAYMGSMPVNFHANAETLQRIMRLPGGLSGNSCTSCKQGYIQVSILTSKS